MHPRTVHFEWRNQPQEGFGYRFKSKAEYRWACYLEKLKMWNQIDFWKYEPKTFEFGERWRKRRQYTPDFLVGDIAENDAGEIVNVYHEVKTSLRQTDVTRFRCLAADYPEEKIVLVIFGPEHTKNAKQNRLRANARKYVERIVFAKPLCKKMGV